MPRRCCSRGGLATGQHNPPTHTLFNFFPQFMSAFAHFSNKLPRWVFILPRWGLILPRIPPPTFVLYSAVTRPFKGYVHTLKTLNPTTKPPLSWPELESGQKEPSSPSGQNETQTGFYSQAQQRSQCARHGLSLTPCDQPGRAKDRDAPAHGPTRGGGEGSQGIEAFAIKGFNS